MGCDNGYIVPVRSRKTYKGSGKKRIYTICSECGQLDIPLNEIELWQLTAEQVLKWFAHELNIKPNIENDTENKNFVLRGLRGNKKPGWIELNCVAPVTMKISGHDIEFLDIVCFENNKIKINRTIIQETVDWPASLTKYKSNTIRSETRKLDTANRNKKIIKMFWDLKKKIPENKLWKYDSACYLEISKQDFAVMKNGTKLTIDAIRKIVKK